MIIQRDELNLMADEEIYLFIACYKWALKRDLSEMNLLAPFIRFSLMTTDQLSSIVEPLNVINQSFLFEGIFFTYMVIIFFS